MPEMSVRPYLDIAFDGDGDADMAELHRLLRLDVTDLVMFAHGWNNCRATARLVHSGFFAPFPALPGPGVRLGYAGIGWPSMRFRDEPVPWAGTGPASGGGAGAALDAGTREALGLFFPGHRDTVARLARLLEERPASGAAFAEFGGLARRLAEVPAGGLEGCFADDLPRDEQGPPALLYEDTLTLCRIFALALGAAEPADLAGLTPGSLRDSPEDAWRGAKELLRQTAYSALKRRAGTVGELGLGRLLGQLARAGPGVRVHLVGHGQGARLVAFALRGLPDGARNVKSVTLLQGAFSHYAFAPDLPHAAQNWGVLRDLQQRVDGPVVACHSRYDSALGVLYPLASRLAGEYGEYGRRRTGGRYGTDGGGALGVDERWRALGHDGFRAVRPAAARLTLARALERGLPALGCVSVDVSAVVRRGGPPSGAHGDIRHPELARLVVAAGRIGKG